MIPCITRSIASVTFGIYNGAKSCAKMTLQPIVEHVVTPFLISATGTIISLGAKDTVIGNIVGGTCCILGGGYLIVKSGIVRLSCLKKRNTSTLAKVSLATMGTAMVAFGTYRIIYGVQELYKRKISQHQEQFLPNFNPNELPNDNKIVQEIIKRLKSCPEAHKLYSQVNQDGLRIQLASPKELPSHALWNSIERTVMLSRDSLTTDQKATRTLFELCNSMRSQQFEQTGLQSLEGKLSELEYMKAMQANEYQSILCHHNIVKKCVSHSQWPGWTDTYKEGFSGPNAPFQNQESAWKDYLKNPRTHSNRRHYQAVWKEYSKPAYCSNHPSAKDCQT